MWEIEWSYSHDIWRANELSAIIGYCLGLGSHSDGHHWVGGHLEEVGAERDRFGAHDEGSGKEKNRFGPCGLEEQEVAGKVRGVSKWGS